MKINSLTSDVLRDLDQRMGKKTYSADKKTISDVGFSVNEKFDSEKKHLLIVFTGTEYGLNESLAELVKAKNNYGFSYDLGFSFSGEAVIGEKGINEIVRRLEPRNTFFEQDQLIFERVMENVEGIVVPMTTQDTVSKLAFGIQDSFISTLLWQALWKGMTILMDFQNSRKYKGTESKSDLQRQMVEEHIEKVKSFGIKELLKDNYIVGMLNGFKNANIEVVGLSDSLVEQTVKKDFPKFVTSKDLLELAGSSKKLTIPSDTVVTPLAMDTAKEHGIEIIKR